MNAELIQAQKAIQNAREALRDGNRSAARRWAEQSAQLAPQLEDPWLILAAVASPKASVAFIERALKLNPDSPRARKGMQWALKRLQSVPSGSGGKTPSEEKKVDGTTQQARAVKRSVPSAPPKKVRKPRRAAVYSALLLALGCVVVLVAAWTASTSPALASILNGNTREQPSAVEHPKVWARVEIAKPAQSSEPEPEPLAADFEPSLQLPTPTSPPPTQEPTAAPPTATLEPTVAAEPTATEVPSATDTPAGSLSMEIVEDTPVPTAAPTQENEAPKPADPPVGNGVHWIEVNLTEQRVYAWEGDVLSNSFIVSTGTWATPTVTGTFHIWNKTRIQTMSGPGYSLPNVPWVMYFYEDYGFHGTYWHNNFGTPMSHGCVNLTIPDSEWLYNWASYGTTVKVHY
jgi:lipoprotein-anchoring transpeptidase ErfK/SrfK